jgi:BlaI family penicillinase repressor
LIAIGIDCDGKSAAARRTSSPEQQVEQRAMRIMDQLPEARSGEHCLSRRNKNVTGRATEVVVGSPASVGDTTMPRLSKAETRILEQVWKLGTCSVREVLESLPADESVAYTTVQTLVYRLEEKGALRKVKKIGNAQMFEAAIDQNEHRSGLLRDLLDLFGGSPRLLVSSLVENGEITLKDLKALEKAAGQESGRGRGGKRHA